MESRKLLDCMLSYLTFFGGYPCACNISIQEPTYLEHRQIAMGILIYDIFILRDT